MDRQQAEVLEGTVEDIVFHNEDTGFTVMEVAAGEALITVVGEAMGIQPGEELRLTGRYVSHPTYGTQFKAAVIERTIPATSGAILKYLSGGAVRGIGPALARRIVDAFGDDTLTIMEKEPQRLAEVRGITPKKAAEIAVKTVREFLETGSSVEHVIFNVITDKDLSIYRDLLEGPRIRARSDGSASFQGPGGV